MVVQPVDATFVGGRRDALQSWYPFPEGFSPAFVHSVLEEFCPTPDRVLDPFAGSGTTPLAVAARGSRAFYCEVNPVYQQVIAAKGQAMTLAGADRDRATRRLAELISEPHWYRDYSSDAALLASYRGVFPGRSFMSEQALHDVARARTALDGLAGDPIHDLVQVAMLAALVPSSNLIRRGDLRFRTPREMARLTDFSSALRSGLQRIQTDLARAPQAAHMPLLVASDSRRLGSLPSLDLDAIVTSPPYLNGTNYTRNSRLELWFIRLLTRQSDLRALRDASIAAGINDVRSFDAPGDLPATVHSLVRRLAESAYDARIPRLVAQYFTDIALAFSSLRVHLRPGAPLIVDIGDSRYGGVHVPTDELLVDVLAGIGYRCESRVRIRERKSRDGGRLRQSLLVLRTEPKGVVFPSRKSLPAQWTEFRRDMPHRRLPMSKRNWGGPLHSLCSYGGKLKPAIAASLVAAFVPKGGRLLDPFAGAGTIPYEAALQGSTAYGFDLSPTAWHITRAKLDPPTEQECAQVLAELKTLLESGEGPDRVAVPYVSDVRFNGGLDDYYHPRTLREILTARSYFLDRQPPTPAHSFVLACLLHILHGNRPYALSRRSHPITPFAPSGDFEYRALIPRLTAKVRRSIAALSPGQIRGEAYLRDAAQPWPAAVERLDAVVTSPPFFDSTRFYLSNWIRMWFTGWNARDFSVRPGNFVEVRQRKSFEVYQPIFRQARERLKPGGFVVLHLGASRKCDMVSELAAVAAPWFRVADTFVEDVSDIEHHGIRDKGTVTAHQYLVLD